MRVRNGRLRTKVTALLVSLTALWAFTAWVTVRDGLNMLGVATLDSGIVQPSEQLLVELQVERRLSLIVLGEPGAGRQQRAALEVQRGRTDKTMASFRELASGGSVQLMASSVLKRRVSEMNQKLDGLQAGRRAIDERRVDRTRAAALFTDAVDLLYHVYASVATLDDEAIAKDARTLIQLSQARELLAQEDAMVAGALLTGRLTEAERVLFAQTVGAQRFLAGRAMAELPPAQQAAYRKLEGGQAFTRLHTMENRLIQGSEMQLTRLVDPGQWNAAVQPVLSELQNTIVTGGDEVVERATPVTVGVIVRLSLAGGLGLLAVIASIVLAITTTRALVLQLEKLRIAAWELANERLPSVVERIGRGENVDIEAEAPPLQFGDDQIGHVGQAFNAVQQTAIKVAAEQAQLRRDIADILRNLARRTQSLVHRQLSVLDVMERRENDPQELRDLFRLDHLATRMRRYAENLLVLSGAAPGRAWRDAVPMIDVVRGSLAEIEDYTRVDVMPLGQVALDGRAVSDVIHLVAELAENAASFSPPYTTVQVSGHTVAHGYALEIEDRGLGMSAENIASANERIANPPELKLSGNARLGLYVVSRLAERHEIRVTFKASPYGGTTVIVLIPQALVTEQEPESVVGAGVHVPQARTAGSGSMTGAMLPVAAMPGREAVGPGGTGDSMPAGRREKAIDEPVHAVPLERREPTHPAVSHYESLAGSGVHSDGGSPGGPGVFGGSDASPGSSGPSGGAGSPMPPVMPPPDTSHTPGGLPRRVPQTHLAAPLQDDGSTPAPESDGDTDERSPDMIRAAMSSFQDGTRRGRSEAAQLLDRGGDPVNDGDPAV
ncbi:nitrate- and nitrite sensing domain-containing protein [Streptosporangium sp. 'caverna']|uniref:sensor histidine kinase n=1 Tax=Streptosporangium sp. 'caverna' TaxID=2202249 RepID=UPI000D7E5FDA|nr:nitrate- and nitrite sensing domain-containing protein [Streptosporangium sp. 'caverna']AWS48821.1 histidine kinase [Streptosporangium sp. 'caverna']